VGIRDRVERLEVPRGPRPVRRLRVSHLPYYGSWGDDNSIIHATAWAMSGPVRVAAPMAQLPPIMLPDPNVLALAAQQARIADLEARLREREEQ
jgi:hypothetical protein